MTAEKNGRCAENWKKNMNIMKTKNIKEKNNFLYLCL